MGAGESGPHARPTKLAWARSLRKAAGDLLDGQVYHEVPEVA
jgi:hypothetical protein